MKISPDVLRTFGEAESTVRNILDGKWLTPLAVEHRDEQDYVRVIAPWPVDYAALNEAQNALRFEHKLPVYLELINPNHPIARYPIEVRTNPAFTILIRKTLKKYHLYEARFGGQRDCLVITVTVGEPFDWARINEAQNELRGYATFELFLEPRNLLELH